jgi:CheY-like chemotaxis protein
MDGYEAIRSIKALENGKIPIIAVTASAFQEDTQKALEAGADAYLRKPFKEHEVFECIETCLGVQYVYE